MLYPNMNGSLDKKQLTSSNKLIVSTNDSNKKVKNLLLQGWRNRWSAPEFATYLKQQLSIVVVSGDNYELSKLMLQQATVGRQPVVLFIDYLHHLLSCGVVSFGSVINSIIETCKKENTQVVICLLDFLLSQEDNINCFSSEQDCLNLATSLARLVKFVFACLEHSLQRIHELINHQFGNQLSQHEQAIEKCSNLLSIFENSQLLISLLYVGLIEENQTKNTKSINFSDFFELKEKLSPKIANNKALLNALQNVVQFIQVLQKLNPNLQAKKYLQFESNLFNYRKSSKLSSNKNDSDLINDSFVDQADHMNKPLVSLNCVVTFDAILNPKACSTKLAYQVYNIAITNHFKFSLISLELIKYSLINFADSLDQNKTDQPSVETKFLMQFQRKPTTKPSKENIGWALFIYFKLPLVLKSLKELLKEKNIALELEKALEKLITYTPLLELIDYKTNCDCLANLLNKLLKLKLIDEEFQRSLLRRREEKIDVFKKENENLVMLQGHILLNRAEPTVDSLFGSLDPWKSVKPESSIQVFVKILTSNSIDLVLNTLTYTGKLREFIKRIICFNETYNHASSTENAKQAAIRGNLFDISFLLLFYIVQQHGQEIILDCLEEEGVDLNGTNNGADDMEIDEKTTTDQANSLANSFFVKFCLDYLPENLSKVNYDEKLTEHVDSNKVEGLLGLFSSDNFDYQLIKWDEVLLNVIGVFKELLQAHLNNHLTYEELTSVYLMNMVKRNCSISLLIAFYAINHMHSLCTEHKMKIIAILNFLTNSNNFSTCYSNQSDAFSYYKEKHTQITKMIRNLMDEQIPKTITEKEQQTKGQEKSLSKENGLHTILNNEISSQVELYKVLRSAFLSTIKKGWLSTSSIHCFSRVLRIGGATWFMDKLIKLLLYECEVENLFEGVELIYGLSTLDMEQCCFALLNVTIPQYLVSHNDQSVLIEPKLVALSKLLSSIIYSVLELNHIDDTSSSNKKDANISKSIVRRNSSCYIEDNFIPYEDRILDLGAKDDANQHCTTSIQFIAKSSLNLNMIKRKELLFNSIARLLRLVSSLLDRQKISQRTAFSLMLLEQLVYTFPFPEHSNQTITNDLDKLISSALNNDVQIILRYLPFDTILNLVRIFPNKINYDLILSISNLQSTNARKLTAKSLCQLSKSKKVSNFMI